MVCAMSMNLAFIILERVNRGNRNREHGTTIHVQNMDAGPLYIHIFSVNTSAASASSSPSFSLCTPCESHHPPTPRTNHFPTSWQ